MTATAETVSTGAPPKWATPRDPDAPTDGGRISKIADALGKPLRPWQRLVADVATERDAFGQYRYEIILVTVPRQSGKTTLVGPVQLDRVICNPGIRAFYTAQTGKDARKRFEDLVALVKESPLDAVAAYRWSAGDEGISFPNRSALKLFAPGLAALHGETPPLVTLDEIWHYDELLGDAMLEGAILPAQMTLTGRRQVWMISTAGTAESVFMKKWVDRGRANESARLAGRPLPWPKLAYFEWSLADGADPYDPQAIADFHPAVGIPGGVTAEDLLATPTSPANWLRGFCNLWTETKDPIFPDELWRDLARDPIEVPRRRDVTITWEAAPGNESGVVMATWRDVDGSPVSRVLHSAPGTRWMVDYIVDVIREWKPARYGADDGGPTRKITDSVRRRLGDTFEVSTTGGRDFGTACDAWISAVNHREFKHDGTVAFDKGRRHLVLKRTGDVVSFSRAASTGPIVAPIASAVGLWLHDHAETVPTRLDIRT
jgi:hypothetical protein